MCPERAAGSLEQRPTSASTWRDDASAFALAVGGAVGVYEVRGEAWSKRHHVDASGVPLW